MSTTETTENNNSDIEITLNSTEYIEFCAYRKQHYKVFVFHENYAKGKVHIKGSKKDFALLGYGEEYGED